MKKKSQKENSKVDKHNSQNLLKRIIEDNITEISLTIGHKFRPIKSQADIEREEAIEEMVEATSDDISRMCVEHAEVLYDKGYRLVSKEVKLDEMIDWFGRNDRWDASYLLKHFHITKRVG